MSLVCKHLAVVKTKGEEETTVAIKPARWLPNKDTIV